MLQVQGVSKVYSLYASPGDRLWQGLRGGHHPAQEFWALRDINLSVARGEVLGVVGPNGSGKSTLLQIVSGILQPTRGRVVTEGRIAALLELGAGFNPEFTGRENVFLNGEVLGMTRAQVARVFDSIAAFADIGAFLERPVKEYSTGMYVRLAFATAIHVDPEILIVDEALSVGDAIFANRCIQKFEQLKEQKVSILFVSHDLGLVKRLCDRAILLLHGKIAAEGTPGEVVNRYAAMAASPQAVAETAIEGGFRHGDKSTEITRIELRGASGDTRTLDVGESVTVRIEGKCVEDVEGVTAGMLIRNRIGVDVFGTNTNVEGLASGGWKAGDRFEAEFAFDCSLARGEYTLTVATQHPDGRSQDWRDDALLFQVASERDVAGVVDLRARVTMRRKD
ncbi:MAG: ABC transporter ATP-binding protein [Bryobacteraceae bacterium]